MKRIHLIFAFGVALLLGNKSQAQLVQVGPGYVKAPFVRVYSYPNGGSYVRAPFVEVYTPGYDWNTYVVPESAPIAVDEARLDWRGLAQRLRNSANQLDADLNSIAGGDAWRAHLKLPEVIANISRDESQPPSAESRQKLLALANNFDFVASSSDASSIANLASFQALRQSLRGYSMVPEQRYRQQLFLFARDLYATLQRFDTAASWQAYLKLAPGMVLSTTDREIDEIAPEVTVPSDTALKEALARFDAARANADYGVITNLPAYRATHECLAAYLRERGKPAVEELPRPAAP